MRRIQNVEQFVWRPNLAGDSQPTDFGLTFSVLPTATSTSSTANNDMTDKERGLSHPTSAGDCEVALDNAAAHCIKFAPTLDDPTARAGPELR